MNGAMTMTIMADAATTTTVSVVTAMASATTATASNNRITHGANGRPMWPRRKRRIARSAPKTMGVVAVKTVASARAAATTIVNAIGVKIADAAK
jgi:hypothetical protein